MKLPKPQLTVGVSAAGIAALIASGVAVYSITQDDPEPPEPVIVNVNIEKEGESSEPQKQSLDQSSLLEVAHSPEPTAIAAMTVVTSIIPNAISTPKPSPTRTAIPEVLLKEEPSTTTPPTKMDTPTATETPKPMLPKTPSASPMPTVASKIITPTATAITTSIIPAHTATATIEPTATASPTTTPSPTAISTPSPVPPTPTSTAVPTPSETPSPTPEAPISYYATYFRLYDGHVWPDCARQRTNKCLNASADIQALYREDRSTYRFAAIKVYPCDVDWWHHDRVFQDNIEDYPSNFGFEDYLAQECGYEPYYMAEGEVHQKDLPPEPITYGDVLRDEIADILGYDDWERYYDEVGRVVVEVDGCTIDVADLEIIGSVWLERYPNEVSWQPEPEYRSPIEASDNVVAALGVIIETEYPVWFDGVAYHDDNWILWAESCGWLQ